MNLQLYYTGAKEYLEEQSNPKLSLGGFVSSSLVPIDVLDDIFGSISNYAISNNLTDTKAFVVKNETEVSITDIKLWYDNLAQNPITGLRMAVVELGVDDCGDYFMEKIVSTKAVPANAIFIDNRLESNAIDIPLIEAGKYMGVWIQRYTISSKIKELNSCDSLYERHIAEDINQIQSIDTVADITDSLNETYWTLDTTEGRYFVWYNTGAGEFPEVTGRESIEVQINTNDTADTVAIKTKNRLNETLSYKDEAVASIEDITNQVIITNNNPGKVNVIDINNTGFTTTLITQGSSKELESIEDIKITFSY